MVSRRGLVSLISVVALSLQCARLASAQGSEAVSLTTRDGVQLKISYFPGSARKGSSQAKQTTPVIFLHDYKGSRAVFAQLVQKLQATSKGQGEADRPGFAVVTVDLRAHGQSTKL